MVEEGRQVPEVQQEEDCNLPESSKEPPSISRLRRRLSLAVEGLEKAILSVVCVFGGR